MFKKTILEWAAKTFIAALPVGFIRFMLLNEKDPIVAAVNDKLNYEKAIETVKRLETQNDMTTTEKIQTFALIMLVWAQDIGRKLDDRMINILRELAVMEVKSKYIKTDGVSE